MVLFDVVNQQMNRKWEHKGIEIAIQFIEKPFPTIFILSRLIVFLMVFYAIIKFLNKKV